MKWNYFPNVGKPGGFWLVAMVFIVIVDLANDDFRLMVILSFLGICTYAILKAIDEIKERL